MKSEWLIENITIKELNQRLRENNQCGWTFVEYLYVQKIIIEKDSWNNLVEKFKKYSLNLQKFHVQYKTKIHVFHSLNFSSPLPTFTSLLYIIFHTQSAKNSL